VLVAAWYGESGTARLLVLSQVILSMQLPFAVVPLVRFTSDRAKMGSFVSPRWLAASAWVVAALIISLNLKLLYDVAAS
jgi:manganese transport protein